MQQTQLKLMTDQGWWNIHRHLIFSQPWSHHFLFVGMRRQRVLHLEEIEVGWLDGWCVVGHTERVRQEARITLIDGRPKAVLDPATTGMQMRDIRGIFYRVKCMKSVICLKMRDENKLGAQEKLHQLKLHKLFLMIHLVETHVPPRLESCKEKNPTNGESTVIFEWRFILGTCCIFGGGS